MKFDIYFKGKKKKPYNSTIRFLKYVVMLICFMRVVLYLKSIKSRMTDPFK